MEKNLINNQFELLRGYHFVYSYFNASQVGANYKRLKLERLETLLEGDAHEFVYSDIALPPKTSYSQDFYGYFNGKTNFNLIPKTRITQPYVTTVGGANRDVDSSKNQAGILTKIYYPTKGWTKFLYETNQYFGAKTTYFTTTATCGAFGTGAGNNNPVIIPTPGEEYDSACPSAPNCIIYNLGNFTVFTPTDGHLEFAVANNVNDNDMQIKYQYVKIRIIINGIEVYNSGKKNKNHQFSEDLSLLPGSGILLAEVWGEHMHVTAGLSFSDHNTVLGNLNAGGIRIHSIENYNYDNNLVGKKIYDYSQIDDSSKSSGVFTNNLSNTFEIPIVKNFTTAICGGLLGASGLNYKISNEISSNSRFGIEANTIAYEYVKESDVDSLGNALNGYTSYKFSTTNDIVLAFGIFINTPWRRGNLLEKTIYGVQNSTFLRKEVNSYFEDNSKISYIEGFKMNRVASININQYGTGQTPLALLHSCFNPISVTEACLFFKYNINIPWYYLKSTTITENFFSSDNVFTGSILNTIDYNYNNPLHLQLSSQTKTNSIGETIKTNYFYPNDSEVATASNVNALKNKNMLLPIRIQNWNSGQLLYERNTVYKDWGNGLIAPEIINNKKSNITNLEIRTRFVKIDSFNGNILQLKQESGTDVVYIYGYNGTKLIAKIENATFNSVVLALGTTEAALKASTTVPLNIRTLLPNAIVTSYIYDPFTGYIGVTDAKGYTLKYYFDKQDRLKSVKDNDNSILSETDYHYRP